MKSIHRYYIVFTLGFLLVSNSGFAEEPSSGSDSGSGGPSSGPPDSGSPSGSGRSGSSSKESSGDTPPGSTSPCSKRDGTHLYDYPRYPVFDGFGMGQATFPKGVYVEGTHERGNTQGHPAFETIFQLAKDACRQTVNAVNLSYEGYLAKYTYDCDLQRGSVEHERPALFDNLWCQLRSDKVSYGNNSGSEHETGFDIEDIARRSERVCCRIPDNKKDLKPNLCAPLLDGDLKKIPADTAEIKNIQGPEPLWVRETQNFDVKLKPVGDVVTLRNSFVAMATCERVTHKWACPGQWEEQITREPITADGGADVPTTLELLKGSCK